jgi:L,D-peptidoglycan transpeptidase YkuD (ErfK/YbiS/YcfS/YnhG family)
MSSHSSSADPTGPGRRRRPATASGGSGGSGAQGQGSRQGRGRGAERGYGAHGGEYDDFRAPYATEPYPADGFPTVPFSTDASAAAPAPGGGPSRTQARAASRERARRRRRLRNGVLGLGSVAALAVLAVAGLLPGHTPAAATSADALSSTGPAPRPSSSVTAVPARTPAKIPPKAVPGFAQIPGLGASFRAKIPASAGQVLLASGRSATTNTVTVVLYTRTAQGTWLPGARWSGHNALDGWTTDHHEGDLHSPIGVYTLTDAGGLYPNPGTKFPYLRSSEFQDLGTGFEGESLADAFNYVIAINYNHVPGTSPLSDARPMGEAKGGGIWVHVDHGGPTHGCISLPQADVVSLLKTLDPARHPVIVMGDAASLAA